MTFEWTSRQQAARERARAFAHTVRPRAADIDTGAEVPEDLVREAAAVVPDDPMEQVLAIEELAGASAALAVRAASDGAAARPIGLAGLRGALMPGASPRMHLALAAVALGIGRAALEAALADLREAGADNGGDAAKPHWVVADAATELEAARLLTWKAAATMTETDVAVARLMSAAAAAKTVDAAIRIAGAPALEAGALLERLARDVRTIGLLLGTEEAQRAAAAAGLLPG